VSFNFIYVHRYRSSFQRTCHLNKHSVSPPIFPLYNLTRTKLMRDDEMILYYRLSCLYEITAQDSVFCTQIFRLIFVGLDSFLHVLSFSAPTFHKAFVTNFVRNGTSASV